MANRLDLSVRRLDGRERTSTLIFRFWPHNWVDNDDKENLKMEIKGEQVETRKEEVYTGTCGENQEFYFG